ncbi:uncharacterized protein LOC141901285 [Tubulanus polymorphus]|uniref:uncharacterized protein LOC141901285 n=1 Tax=Tubulanus polymorphus TaxID=672921 RepID=UPI003DA33FBB
MSFLNDIGASDESSTCTNEVLYLAAHVCYKFNVEDSDLVSAVFEKVMASCGNFDRFFEFLDPMSLVFEIENNLYPYRYNEKDGHITKARLRALEYFIPYITRYKATQMFFDPLSLLPSESDDFVLTAKRVRVALIDSPLNSCRGSTPILLACHSCSPEAVQLLLRYGCKAMPVEANGPGLVQPDINTRHFQPIYQVTSKLNALVFWRSRNVFDHLTEEENDELQNQLQKRESVLVDILKLFGAAVRKLPVKIAAGDSLVSTQSTSLMFYLNPYYAKYPDLVLMCSPGPSPLVHLCRCAIRETMRECETLPSGINKLPLPKMIQKYLDLHLQY